LGEVAVAVTQRYKDWAENKMKIYLKRKNAAYGMAKQFVFSRAGPATAGVAIFIADIHTKWWINKPLLTMLYKYGMVFKE